MTPSGVTVRPVRPGDRDAWLAMRAALWPDGSVEEHAGDIDAWLADPAPARPEEVLVAADPGGTLVGFAELAIRPYAEGCVTDRVAYLEGWYVTPEWRGQAVGAALVHAAEAWGRGRGCREFASDADPANQASIAAHLALGFRDAGLVHCFHKSL